LENQVFTTPRPERNHIAAMYRDYMREKIKSGTHLKYMVKHMLGLYAGMPGARAYRRYLSENMFSEHAGIEVLDKALELIQDHSGSEAADSLQAELQ